jgi:hypothetical protein
LLLEPPVQHLVLAALVFVVTFHPGCLFLAVAVVGLEVVGDTPEMVEATVEPEALPARRMVITAATVEQVDMLAPEALVEQVPVQEPQVQVAVAVAVEATA